MCEKRSIGAYPCMERAGIVWAYMGPKDKQPEGPGVEWANLPDSHVFVSKRMQECNYMQAMEGGIDTSHVSFVHKFEVDRSEEHTSELQSLMRISYAVFCLKKNKKIKHHTTNNNKNTKNQ